MKHKRQKTDWDALWRSARARGGTISPEIWESKAPSLRRWMANDGYAGRFLKRIRLRPGWTVLDVGCGPGDVAIPVARMVRRVTAVDVSAGMLGILEADAAREGLANIDCVRRPWDGDGPEVGRHDVVIASRSIGMMDGLGTALERIDQAAVRYAYVTMGDGQVWPLKRIMYGATGRRARESPGYIYAYNLLYEMGIRANVDFIEGRSTFPDYGDFVEYCRWVMGGLDRDEERAILKAFDGVLEAGEDGLLRLPYNDLRWALIWWKKAPQTGKK